MPSFNETQTQAAKPRHIEDVRGNKPMHYGESLQVYLTAKDLAERAHKVYIMKTCQCGDIEIAHHERELAKEYRELRSKLFERGLI